MSFTSRHLSQQNFVCMKTVHMYMYMQIRGGKRIVLAKSFETQIIAHHL